MDTGEAEREESNVLIGVAGAWKVLEVMDSVEAEVGAEADAEADAEGDGAAEDKVGASVETGAADEAGDEDELGAGAGATPFPPANLAAKQCLMSGWSMYQWSPRA